MSRSALWRQESNVKERERLAIDTFHAAVEEGRRCHGKGQIPLVGPDDTFNLNPMLLHNISKSQYFQKCCHKLTEWSALVDEIYYEVKHMEPWTAGATRMPSTAFCLLVRLFTLRCTEKQMTLMLDHHDSPFIRCIGFLYLRYATDPARLYDWFEPYLYDEEPVQVSPAKAEITVGEYARSLLTDMEYCNGSTLLPRLPVVTERELKVKLLHLERCEDRAKEHLSNDRCMDYFRTVGSEVRALYGDDENPVAWYDAVIDRVITRDDDTGELLTRPKFKVTFPEYGNVEIVSLGEIDVKRNDNSYHRSSYEDYSSRHGSKRDYYDDDRGRYRHRRGDDRSHRTYDYSRDNRRGYESNGNRRGSHHDQNRNRERSRSRSRERDNYGRQEEDLLEKVRQQEREKSTAKGKAYASRPRTFKDSLGLKQDGYEKKKSGGSPNKYSSRDNVSHRKESAKPKEEPVAPPPVKKTPEELRAIEEKKRKLLAKYG